MWKSKISAANSMSYYQEYRKDLSWTRNCLIYSLTIFCWWYHDIGDVGEDR